MKIGSCPGMGWGLFLDFYVPKGWTRVLGIDSPGRQNWQVAFKRFASQRGRERLHNNGLCCPGSKARSQGWACVDSSQAEGTEGRSVTGHSRCPFCTLSPLLNSLISHSNLFRLC